MLIIQKIYQIFLDLFKSKTIKTKPINNEEYIGALSFYITKNKDIDIACSIPDISDISLNDLEILAETYAEFLSYINEGYLKNDILDILKSKHKNNNLTETQKSKYKLFFDNVVFNWVMIHTENSKRKKQSKKDDQPLIRPSSVFHPS